MIAATFLWLIAGSAIAQERPLAIPARDVDVTYHAGTTSQRMRWLQSEQKLRIDPPGNGLFMIVDYRTRRMLMVRPEDRKVVDLASPLKLPGQDATDYTRRGSGTAAGLPCTEWQTHDSAGQEATVCLTADGVLLRASRGGTMLVEATAVTYAAQNPADFRAPPGFEAIVPPAQPTAPIRSAEPTAPIRSAEPTAPIGSAEPRAPLR